MSYWFLPYITMNQPYVYICPLPLEPASHLPPHRTSLGCGRAQDWVPCVSQQLAIRPRHREQTCGYSRGRRGWDELREQDGNIHITMCERDGIWIIFSWRHLRVKRCRKITSGTFLVGQWVRFCTSPAGGVGSTPGLGTKFLQGVPCGQKVKRKKKPFWTSFIRLKAENSEPLYYLPQIPFAEMHPQRPHSMSSPHIYLPSVWHPWKLKTFSFVLSPFHKCIGLC